MSFSSFPLEFVLQVRDEMSGGLGQATTELQNVDRAAQSAERSTGTLENRVKGANTNFLQLGLGIAAAAGGIINLIRQYHNFRRAQGQVENMSRREENAQLTLTNARQNLADAIKKHGKNSKEAEKAQRALTKAENNAESAGVRLKNAQVALNDRMLDFAVSIVPSTVGVVAGLAQTFQITSQSMGGGRGFLGALGRFFLPLAALGVALLAIKTNFLGFRDALNQVGFQIGQMFPALQPFLNALNDLGVVLGIVPGNAQEAQEALKKFGGGVVKWGKEVFDTISKIAKKFVSGDILGGIVDIKMALGSIKIGSFTLEQWAAALPALIKVELEDANGNIPVALKNIVISIANVVLGADTVAKIKTAINNGIQTIHDSTKESGKILLNERRGFLWNVLDQIFPGVGSAWANELSVRIAYTKIAIKQGFISVRNALIEFFQNPMAVITNIANFLTSLIGTLPTVDQISDFLTTNILIPLQNAWGFVQTAVGQHIENFPLFQIAGAGVDIMFGTITGFVDEISQWFTDNIVTPLQNEWNALKENETLKSLWGFLTLLKTDPLAALGQLFSGGGADKNFSTPIALFSGSDNGIFDRDVMASINPFRGNSTGGGGNSGGLGGLTGNNEDVLLPISTNGEEQITVLQQILNDIVLIRSVATENFNAMGQIFNQVVTNMGAVWNTFATSVNTVLIALQASFATLFTQGIGTAWITLMISMSSLANVTVQAIALVFGGMVVNISAGMTGLANTWSVICNSFGANAKSGASQIIAAFNSAASAAIAAFNRMRSAAQATFNAIVSAANRATSAVRSLISTMNSIPNIKRTITITTVRRTVNAAKGFNGIVTTPTTFNVGEGFKPELVSVTPLTGGGGANITNQVTTKNKGSNNNNQPIMVQVFLDGEQVRGKIVQGIVKGQAAFT